MDKWIDEASEVTPEMWYDNLSGHKIIEYDPYNYQGEHMTEEKIELTTEPTLYFNNEAKEIVRFVIYKDGKNVFQYVYYGFKPNWFVRFNMWASGFTAEWVDEDEV